MHLRDKIGELKERLDGIKIRKSMPEDGYQKNYRKDQQIKELSKKNPRH